MLTAGVRDVAWLEELGERLAQVMWVLDHLEDIDADFLAMYRLDLERDEVSGPRFFALAHRLTAYQGVMAVRVEAERDRHEGRTSSPTAHQQDASSSGTREVSLTAFRVMFPGIVSSSGGGQASGG